jgi:hypothetical protein
VKRTVAAEDVVTPLSPAEQAVVARFEAAPDPYAEIAIEVDEGALTAAHLAVEDLLIEMRDGCISVVGPANGFVIRGKDGVASPIMRLGTREGLRVAIEAYIRAASRSSREARLDAPPQDAAPPLRQPACPLPEDGPAVRPASRSGRRPARRPAGLRGPVVQ